MPANLPLRASRECCSARARCTTIWRMPVKSAALNMWQSRGSSSFTPSPEMPFGLCSINTPRQKRSTGFRKSRATKARGDSSRTDSEPARPFKAVIRYAGRAESASPAGGMAKRHEEEQHQLVDDAFAPRPSYGDPAALNR